MCGTDGSPVRMERAMGNDGKAYNNLAALLTDVTDGTHGNEVISA